MIFFNKMIFLSVCVLIAAVGFTSSIQAQMRDAVIKTASSRPTNLPPASVPPAVDKTQPLVSSRRVLTNKIIVVKPEATESPLVKKTGSSMAVNASGIAARKSAYGAGTSSRLDQAIKSRYGIRYLYGSSGPNTYDCSGFVWSTFQEAGIKFTRASARSLWEQSEPVEDAARFEFGTLVFLNRLGHMGIVADEKGFYHASTSKGITYSSFKGYWEKRIVGFRKLKTEVAPVEE